MASRAEYLKGKRKVRRLSSMIRREFDSGVDNRRRPNPYKKDQIVNRSDKSDKVIPQTVNRTGKSNTVIPQTVNRSAKGDLVIPQTVNRTGKSDKVKVQTVNRSVKSDMVIPQTVNRANKEDMVIPQTVNTTDKGDRKLRKAAGTLTKPYERKYTSPIGPRKPIGYNAAPPGGPPSGTSISRPTAATPTATAGTGTSTGATEKLSAFERLKARQYEKEGYGGKVMTRKKATEQVIRERQNKSLLSGLFKRKGK